MQMLSRYSTETRPESVSSGFTATPFRPPAARFSPHDPRLFALLAGDRDFLNSVLPHGPSAVLIDADCQQTVEPADRARCPARR
jgi:hypothetical protein